MPSITSPTTAIRPCDLSSSLGLLPLAAGHDLVAGYHIDRQGRGYAAAQPVAAWASLTQQNASAFGG